MSELPQREAAIPAREAPRKRRAQRWTDTGAVLLLCVSVGVVVVAALPSLLRAAGLTVAPEDTASHDEGRLRLPTPPLGAPGHPILAPSDEDDEDDEPRVTQLERDFPEGMLPGHRSAEDRLRDRAIFGAPPGSSAAPKMGRAVGPLQLFEDPLPGSRRVAIVAKGTQVQIIREVGEWAMVRSEGGSEPIRGWVQKSEISVR